MTDRDDVAAEIDALGRVATTPWVPLAIREACPEAVAVWHNLRAMQAERDAALRERDRAVETRENANACSRRLEAERDELRAEVARLRAQWDALTSDAAVKAAGRAIKDTMVSESSFASVYEEASAAIRAAMQAAQATTEEEQDAD